MESYKTDAPRSCYDRLREVIVNGRVSAVAGVCSALGNWSYMEVPRWTQNHYYYQQKQTQIMQ